MDKNRLVQIANHFDKIGAYTISDEFENKFIREAQTVKPGIKNRRKSRNKIVTDLAPTAGSAPIESAWNVISGFFRTQGDPIQKRNADNLSTLTYIKTWKSILGKLSLDSTYSSDSKKMNLLRSIAGKIRNAESNFLRTIPSAIASRTINVDGPTETRIVGSAGDDEVVLREYLAWVDYEDQTYKRSINKDLYINELRSAELDFTKLAFPDAIETTPVAPPKPTPAPTPAPAPKPTPQGGSNKPAGGGSTSGGSGNKPTGGGVRTQGGGSSRTQPSGGNSKPSQKTNQGPISVNEELSKIVFRKLRASKNGVPEKDIFLDMRLEKKYKAYLEISKDAGLKGSIIAGINATNFTPEYKKKLIDRLNAKIQKAIELNKAVDPVKPEPLKPEPPKPEPSPGPVDPNKPEPVDPNKPDPNAPFNCTREGLFNKITEMDNLHNNDVDKYIKNYFGDIKLVIDCHSKLREKLEHKDNIYLDTLINRLEAKYFAAINKTQFPY